MSADTFLWIAIVAGAVSLPAAGYTVGRWLERRFWLKIVHLQGKKFEEVDAERRRAWQQIDDYHSRWLSGNWNPPPPKQREQLPPFLTDEQQKPDDWWKDGGEPPEWKGVQ